MTIEELRQKATAVFLDQYPLAKKAMIELEVFTRARSKKAVYELRDVLDHYHSVLTEEDPDQVRYHMEEIRTHLRRCTVEPMEYLAEKQFVRVDTVLRRIRFVPFASNPAMSTEAFRDLHRAQQLIIDGRLLKTDALAAYNKFKEAFGITTALKQGINPIRITLSVAGSALAAVAALVAILTFAGVTPTGLLPNQGLPSVADGPVTNPEVAK